MTADRLAPERLARLEAQQTVFVRLLFDNEAAKAYRDAPEAFLAREGLDPSFAASLPDVGSDAFKAEAGGRRTLIVREVEQTFVRTGELLSGRDGGAGDPLDIAAFMASNAFYDPHAGLPHPAGVGPGYESASKFFFWYRARSGVAALGADIDLRTALYSDFAAYLMGVMQKPAPEFFRRFTGGVYWPRSPATPAPVHLVTDKFRFVTVTDAAKVGQLARIGLQDLDTVKPAAAPPPDNI